MKILQKPIIEVPLDHELDIVIAYKKAIQLAELCGLSFTEQTKFSTAVSEICRNALLYAGKGCAEYYIQHEGNRFYIYALVRDQGPGIPDLELLLQTIKSTPDYRKTGLFNCRRLSHVFEIESSEKGTQVLIGRRLPANHPPINHIILSGWRKHFSSVPPISPYEELKRQNTLLLETLEDLKQKNIQTEEQLEEIKNLNDELALNYEKIKALSEEAKHKNELLTKRNEELDEFAHIVSHDLKSPIKNLQMLVELLESGRTLDQQKAIGIFRSQLQKVDQLIEDILFYSRAGHEKVEKKQVNVNRLIQGIIADLPVPTSTQIEVEEEFPVLYTEEILLYQLFSNLLSNAIKYARNEPALVKVGYNQQNDSTYYFFVEDNGPGIPEAKREDVFKIFTMLVSKKEATGSTGIGLAIVKKIVSEKGGKVWIEDARSWETGARFCFSWPAPVIA